MAIIQRKVNVLNLWFKPEEGGSKLYKVQIKDPKPGLSREQIRSACNEIEDSQVFDFNDLECAYHLVKAHYYRRNSQPIKITN